MTDYVAVKPGRVTTTGYNLRQGSISLRHGDRLIRRFFIAPGWDDKHTLGQLRLESYWQHYHMLAKALRRSPLELERTRQLLAYAGVLVTAPACQGRARTVAARTVDRAIHEHKAAAQAIESGQDQLAAERLARVARFVARAAHEVASACASGQDLPPPLAPALYDIPTSQDQPSLFEQTADPYTDHPELTPERVKAALAFLEEEEGRA
ncbi:MAG: hypothetical protein IPK80_19750 [Nannocystis sp.]|nr:hypothetical protein [Nannocystis sp.]